MKVLSCSKGSMLSSLLLAKGSTDGVLVVVGAETVGVEVEGSEVVEGVDVSSLGFSGVEGVSS